MKAADKFTGIIDGKEKTFPKGAKISAKDATALGLDKKPELVEPAKA